MEDSDNLRTGTYEHYKGNQYEVLGIASHSETLEKFAVYKALYGEGAMWIRPLEMFKENVEIDGETKPRFRYIGE